MDRWSQLSLKDKSDLMSLYIQNGISSLEEIKKHYNSFQAGGPVPSKTPNFVQRFNEGNKRDIPFQGGHATHLLSYAERDGKYYVYPEVQPTDYNNSNSPLQYYGRDWRVAFDRAYDNNDYLEFDTEEAARNYSENYKKVPSIGAVLNGRNRGNYNILDYMRGYATGGHLYQTGGPDDPPSWYKPLTVAGTTPETSDNTYVYNTIADSQIDRREGLPKGTTTARKAMLTKVQPVISQREIPEDTQNAINKAVRLQKIVEPVNQALDVAENIPVVGDAITVGRAASDATYGDYTAASLLPLMWLGNKIPFGKTGVKQATKTALKRKATTDPFVELLQQKTGRTITRVPIKQTKLGEIYSDGFSFVDDSGKEVAHIAGSRNRDNAVFVESSFMAPELRRRGLGKKMYFDFNNQTFDKYGTTLHSSPYQHQLTLETEPGSGVFISPSSNLWRGLKKNGLATMGGSGLDKYYVMASPVDEAYKKASQISINYSDELKKFIENNRDRIDAERALGHGFDSSEVDQALKYYKDTFNIDLTRQEANDLLTARYLNLRDATSGLAEGQRLGIVHNPHTWNTSFNLFNNANEEIGHMAVHKQPNEPKYYVAGVSNKTPVKDETGKIIGNREHKVARDLYDMLLDVENTPFITGQDLLNPQATMKTILKDGYTRTLRPDLKHLWMGDAIIDGKKIEPMASEITSHTPREINNVVKSLLFDPSTLDNGSMNVDLLGGLYRKFGGKLK